MAYLLDKKSNINKISYDIENIDIKGMIKKIIDLFFEEKEKRGLTNTELAEITGISHSYITRLDKDRSYNISVHVLVRLVAAMDLDIKDFWPKQLQKTKTKTEYGELFEYMVQNLPEFQIEFLLDFVKMYSEKQADSRAEERFD